MALTIAVVLGVLHFALLVYIVPWWLVIIAGLLATNDEKQSRNTRNDETPPG